MRNAKKWASPRGYVWNIYYSIRNKMAETPILDPT